MSAHGRLCYWLEHGTTESLIPTRRALRAEPRHANLEAMLTKEVCKDSRAWHEEPAAGLPTWHGDGRP